MALYWAESIEAPGLGIVSATPGNRFFLTHTDRALWENAALEDWEFLDATVNGELFKHYRLVPCPDGTPLTNETVERAN